MCANDNFLCPYEIMKKIKKSCAKARISFYENAFVSCSSFLG